MVVIRKCFVPGCTDKTSRRYYLPMDKNIRVIWLERIKNEKLPPSSVMYLGRETPHPICKSHFSDICIDDAGRLKKYSLPTLNLPDFNEPSTEENCFHRPAVPKYVIPAKLQAIFEKVFPGDAISHPATFTDDINPIVQKPERSYGRRESVVTPLSHSDKDDGCSTEVAEEPSGLQLVDENKQIENLNSCDENIPDVLDRQVSSLADPDIVVYQSTESNENISLVPGKNISLENYNDENANLNEEGFINIQLDRPVSPYDNYERGWDKPLTPERSTHRGKPYFKSLKSLLQDSNRITEVCRVCFKSLEQEEVIKLYEESPQDNVQIKNMLKLVLPDLDLEIYPNSVICTKCAELLLHSYHLKEKWLSTEEKLQKIIEDKKGMMNSDSVLLIIGKRVENIKKKSVTITPQIDHDYNRELVSLEPEKKCLPKKKRSYVSLHRKPMDSNMVSNKRSKQKKNAKKTPKYPRGGVKPYKCEYCGISYRLVESYNAHLKQQDTCKRNESKIMCETCGHLCITYAHLVRHKETHLEHTCTVCDRVFIGSKKLRIHMDAKHLPSSFQCHFCGKQFPYRTSLNSHLRTHNPSSKKNACNICNKKFIFNSKLVRHLQCHAEGRLFKCDYCGRFLKRKSGLKKHIQIYHLNQGKNVCEFCNKPFWKSCDLQKHRFRVHWDGLPRHESNEVSHEEICAVHSIQDVLTAEL